MTHLSHLSFESSWYSSNCSLYRESTLQTLPASPSCWEQMSSKTNKSSVITVRCSQETNSRKSLALLQYSITASTVCVSWSNLSGEIAIWATSLLCSRSLYRNPLSQAQRGKYSSYICTLHTYNKVHVLVFVPVSLKVCICHCKSLMTYINNSH